MTSSVSPSDSGLFGSLDLRGFWETVRLRWWVIPITPLLAVGFLWAQETDLRTEPASYLISRTYEARDPTGVLASVGIDPVSVRSFPDVNNQLIVLQSAKTKAEIAAVTGNSATVTVTRSKPTFALVDTLESDGQSSFVFQSAGVPTYSFGCNEPQRETCLTAIDAYVAKASTLRTESLRAGLEDLKAVLVETNMNLNDTALRTKIAAIDVLLERAATPLALVGEYEEAIGATLTSVRRPTYTFGIAAGLLISLLILLQLTASDSRIRSLRALHRLVGREQTLGQLAKSGNEISDRRVAVALRQQLTRGSAGRLRFIPLRHELTQNDSLARVAVMASTQTRTSLPLAAMTIDELTAPSSEEMDVFVVQRHQTRRADVSDAMALAQRSSRQLAGFLLVD